MNPKKARRRPGPSYEEGELRDKGIEQMQDPAYKKSDLHNLVKKAVQVARKPAKRDSGS